ncbi:MAG: hypothetical protein GY915_01410 [bacterium]|nr:hypothetical protein [bacterium]
MFKHHIGRPSSSRLMSITSALRAAGGLISFTTQTRRGRLLPSVAELVNRDLETLTLLAK